MEEGIEEGLADAADVLGCALGQTLVWLNHIAGAEAVKAAAKLGDKLLWVGEIDFNFGLADFGSSTRRVKLAAFLRHPHGQRPG